MNAAPISVLILVGGRLLLGPLAVASDAASDAGHHSPAAGGDATAVAAATPMNGTSNRAAVTVASDLAQDAATQHALATRIVIAAQDANGIGRHHLYLVNSNWIQTDTSMSSTRGKPGTITIYRRHQGEAQATKVYVLTYGANDASDGILNSILTADGHLLLLPMTTANDANHWHGVVRIIDLDQASDLGVLTLAEGHEMHGGLFLDPDANGAARVLVHETWGDNRAEDGMQHRFLLAQLATHTVLPLAPARAWTSRLSRPDHGDGIFYEDARGLEGMVLGLTSRPQVTLLLPGGGIHGVEYELVYTPDRQRALILGRDSRNRITWSRLQIDTRAITRLPGSITVHGSLRPVAVTEQTAYLCDDSPVEHQRSFIGIDWASGRVTAALPTAIPLDDAPSR